LKDPISEIKEELDQVARNIQAKQMNLSFEGGKMTSTLVNLDLEEMSFCLSQAILVHIEHGDSCYEHGESYQSADSSEADEFGSSEEVQDREQSRRSLNTISEKTIENTVDQSQPQQCQFRSKLAEHSEFGDFEAEEVDFEESRQEMEIIIRESMAQRDYAEDYEQDQESYEQDYEQDYEQELQEPQPGKKEQNFRALFVQTFSERSADPVMRKRPNQQSILNYCKNVVVTSKMEKEVFCLI